MDVNIVMTAVVLLVRPVGRPTGQKTEPELMGFDTPAPNPPVSQHPLVAEDHMVQDLMSAWTLWARWSGSVPSLRRSDSGRRWIRWITVVLGFL